MDVKEMFGSKIKELRKERGLTQKDLAIKAGITRAYYQKVETGKKNISIINQEKIANALEVPLQTLFQFAKGN